MVQDECGIKFEKGIELDIYKCWIEMFVLANQIYIFPRW